MKLSSRQVRKRLKLIRNLLFIAFVSLLFCCLLKFHYPHYSGANIQKSNLYANNISSSIYADELDYYAQILENCYLYSTNDISTAQKIFILPQSYYVELLSKDDNFFQVNYSDISGYVLKSQVRCVLGTPKIKSLENIRFRILGEQSRIMRSEPTSQNGLFSLIYELPLYEINLKYYGEIPGEELVSGRSDIWYYTKYIKDNTVYYGYIYSGLCDELTDFSQLEENLQTSEEPSFAPAEIVEDTSLSLSPTEENLPSNQELYIIIGVSFPVLLLLFFLIRPTFTNRKSVTTKNNVTYIKKRRKKRADYFEYDE